MSTLLNTGTYSSDLIEKQQVSEALQFILGSQNDYSQALSSHHFSTEPGSTVYQALQPGMALLEELTDDPEFIEVCSYLNIPRDSQMYVDTLGVLHVLREQNWYTYQDDFARHPGLIETFGVLAEMAKLCGGRMFRHSTVALNQWLSLNDYAIPKTAEQFYNLIAFLNFEFPAPPSTGDFWAPLIESKNSFLYTHEQQTAIRNLTRQFVKERKLLDVLMHDILGGMPVEAVRMSSDQAIEQLLTSAVGRRWAQGYLDALQWYGSSAVGGQASAEMLDQVLLSAILLDLQPQPQNAPRQEVAGYRLYSSANLNRTFVQVRTDIEAHLSRTGVASGNAVPLAAHLLLALSAPEFLVKEVPDTLLIGSVGWVALRCDVAIAERCMPGVSRAMSPPLMDFFGGLEPVTEKHQQVREFASIQPILDWASINGLITDEPDAEYKKEDLSIAFERFNEFTQGLEQSVRALTTPVPTRRELTLGAMQAVLPPGDYLEQNNLQYKTIFAVTELVTVGLGFLRQSLVDFHMSDDLVVDGELSKKLEVNTRFEIPASVFPLLNHLPSSKTLYDDAFAPYYKNLQAGLLTALKLAFTQMPEADRAAFENGQIDVFTVREKASGFVDMINNQETQKQRDEAKGRYGLILCASYQQRLHTYELFSLQGLCVQRPALADRLVATGTYDQSPSMSFAGDRYAFEDKTEHQRWPLDADAYIRGQRYQSNASSDVIVEKLYTLSAPAGAPRNYGAVRSYFSDRIASVAQSLLENHPVATRAQLYEAGFGATELEMLRKRDELQKTGIINIIIPFKQCIADLASDDPERLNEGVGGCILDGLAFVGAVIGLVSAVAGVAAKSTSAVIKIVGIAKVAASAVASLLNPVDGLPSLLAGGYKLARKGLLLLSKQGLASLEGAVTQLRRLTASTQSYDLVKAASRSDVFQGTWRSLSGDELDLLVIENKSDWYTLNLRSGKPSGPRLSGLKLSHFSLSNIRNRLLPNSYARNYVSKSLPIARRKLDLAVQQMAHFREDPEIRALFKCVFGRDYDHLMHHFNSTLIKMSDDMEALKISNVVFENSKGGDALAGLFPKRYNSWKMTRTADAANKKFMVIHSEGMSDFYRANKYDDGRIADALIHEIAHGAPGTLDLSYANLNPRLGNPGEIDVSPLLNLGNNPSKVDPLSAFSNAEGFTEWRTVRDTKPPIVRERPALLNADSYELAIALLHQRASNKEAFQRNLWIMQKAVNDTGAELLTAPVIVNLKTRSGIKVYLPNSHTPLSEAFMQNILESSLEIAARKVDRSIDALVKKHGHEFQVDQLLIALFGAETPSVRDKYLSYLQDLKKDLSALKPTDIALEIDPGLNVAASTSSSQYRDWKAAVQTGAPRREIMTVYADRFFGMHDRAFDNNGVTAHVLLRELFQCSPGALELSHLRAGESTRRYQQAGVEPLLNLASRRSLSSDIPNTPDNLPGLHNADSLAVMTELLSQMRDHSQAFLDNAEIIETARKSQKYLPISERTWIRLHLM